MEGARYDLKYISKIISCGSLIFSYSQANNDIRTAMQGMTMKSIKHHVALQPLFVIMGAGIAFVCLYVGR